MTHLISCNIKVLVSNKALVFWTLAFPILLGILFKMAFGDIINQESFDTVPVAVVNSQTYQDSPFKAAFEELSAPGSSGITGAKKPVLKVQNVGTLEEGKQLLSDEKVSGVVEVTGMPVPGTDEKPDAKLTISANGMDQSILKIVLDEIIQRVDMIAKLADAEVGAQISSGTPPESIDAGQIAQAVQRNLEASGFVLNDRSPKSLDLIMAEFFSLVAMAALYGGMFSMTVMNNAQPPLGVIGRRVAVAPTRKAKLIGSGIISSYLVQLVGLILLLAVCHFIFGIDFGQNWALTFLLTTVGALVGLSFGTALSTLVPGGENMKIGVLIGLTMMGSVMAGMMGGGMRYMIDQSVPLMNKVNPVALITDGFYNLFYHPGFEGFWLDVLLLLGISVLLLGASLLVLRRQRYDSL
ncbi:ABC transporter permease [Propionimicrobium lymphophilum]|uniref:ABC transporter permease n=1 Tax=Propionimicrobium lymphophilum TaxID=33012 RepID=UPI00254FAE17|nr:ABC transporter permease [Propionimicrobium lymphophilum]MDK7709003.1 ABC transporter permease [Propionimicrobium lymphophilum]MDK7733050.1 ABC transporter permease [Propionimicrobium lymphophilum]